MRTGLYEVQAGQRTRIVVGVLGVSGSVELRAGVCGWGHVEEEEPMVAVGAAQRRCAWLSNERTNQW